MKRGGNASAVSECRVGGRESRAEADYRLIAAISALHCDGNLWRLIKLDSRIFDENALTPPPLV